jgi:hypothetical protein
MHRGVTTYHLLEEHGRQQVRLVRRLADQRVRHLTGP